LDLTIPALLRLSIETRNPTTGAASLQIRVNGETDNLDWHSTGFNIANGVGNNERFYDEGRLTAYPAGAQVSCDSTIAVTSSGFVCVVSRSCVRNGTDSTELRGYAATKNTAITSLSSIEIVSSATGGLGSGSVFMLEYLAP
jgi:hypothetical protein